MENNLETKNINFDKTYEASIRPKMLKDFLGQSKAKEMLDIFIQAAKKRNESLEHTLFYGPPGLGKTTLSNIIANEMGGDIKIITGPSIERAGDIVSIVTGLKENDILFIDEIHRLNKNIEEILYPVMEDFVVDINIKNPKPRNIRLSVPKFTLIGATTRAGMLSSPLRDRFGITCSMEYYSKDELIQIIKRSAKIFNLKIDDESVEILASASRGTPRIANRLVKRVRDYADVKNNGVVDKKTLLDCMNLLNIYPNGLDGTDIKILNALKDSFSGNPVGVETLSHFIGEDVLTIEDMYEPYLLKEGYIIKTTRGRKITDKAIELLNAI